MSSLSMIGPRITELHITPIAITDPPLLNAAGMHAPYALRTVIELITSDGISGLSEIPGNTEIDRALRSAKKCIINKDPFQLNLIRDDLKTLFGEDVPRGEAPWDQRKLVHVFSAFEVACLDIIGKITSRPVFDLLGGKQRDKVPFTAYLFYKREGAGGVLGFGNEPRATDWNRARQRPALEPVGIVDQALAMCESYGFQSIKLKGGVFPPDEEVKAILALHEQFGREMPLRFDPNAVWSLETALKFGKRMKPHLEYLEDPVRGQIQMATLRKHLQVPIATNMCTTSFADLPQSFRLASEDIILSDHHFWGGLRASMSLAGICEIFDRKLSMHSNTHLGISLAAMVHLGAALPTLPYALDTHYPWQSEEIIKGGRFEFIDGALPVAEEPGLGIELDREKLEELHQNYLHCGLTERDDEAEMRKLNPNWRFSQTRW
ncbi:MAG: glucarate dehydratase [Saprospiraceae bacterium]|nr:glucarate dehydratase [Saprospiraceae bacterium]